MKLRRTILLLLMLVGAIACLTASFIAYVRGEESIHGYRPIMLSVGFLFCALVFWIRRGAED